MQPLLLYQDSQKKAMSFFMFRYQDIKTNTNKLMFNEDVTFSINIKKDTFPERKKREKEGRSD